MPAANRLNLVAGAILVLRLSSPTHYQPALSSLGAFAIVTAELLSLIQPPLFEHTGHDRTRRQCGPIVN